NPGIDHLTILFDPTSDTSNAALTAAQTEAAKAPVIPHVTALPAANPGAVQALVPAQVVGMFMLCPSGMFYDAGPRQNIITLVASAGVPAIFPEKEFTAGHPHWKHYGHNINKTYKKAAKLACDLLQGTLTQGGEAPDMDNNT